MSSVADLYTPESLKACGEAFIASVRSTCLSEEDFQREFCCRPSTLANLVDGEVYDRLALEPVPKYLDPKYAYGPLYVGIDCGRSHDLTVAWVLERGEDKQTGAYLYRTVCVHTISREPFHTQFVALLPIIEHGAVERGFIDQGAQGRALADEVKEVMGSVVMPLGMGSRNKAVMAERLRAYAQSERVSFPKGDALIRSSILCVRKTVTLAGTLQYGGSTTQDHGDAFWAMALALHAAEEEKTGPVYIPQQHTLPAPPETDWAAEFI